MRLDRLARDMVLKEQLLAEVRRMGGDVFSTSAAGADFLIGDPDDASRKLIRQMLGAVAEYEKSMVVLRMRSGRRRKAERGGYAFGAPSFGYRADPDTRELRADDAEQAALDRIRTLRSDGQSIRGIIVGSRRHPYEAR